jgi:hypothetical protein
MRKTYFRTRIKESYKADSTASGAMAGVIAGSCMALITMLISASAGMGFWHPLALMGAVFYGTGAIFGGLGPVVTGLIVHLIITAGLGAAFGSMLPRSQATTGKSAGWGILFGLASWGLVTYIVLPILNQTMRERIDLAPGWWFFSFLIYGLFLGFTPTIRQSIGRDVEHITFEETRKAA